MIYLLKNNLLVFLLFALMSATTSISYSQVCSEIQAAGLVYCDNESVVELRAEIEGGSCNNVEWYSSAAIDIPLSTGCSFITPALTGNIKYFVRDNTNQSRVIDSDIGMDFNNPSLTNPNDTEFDGNIRTAFTPTQDFVLNTVQARIARWFARGMDTLPPVIRVEIRNYSNPAFDTIIEAALPAGFGYNDNETFTLDIDYNFIAFDNYDISFAQNNLRPFYYEGTAGVDIDFDTEFSPVVGVTAAGPRVSRDAGIEGFGPFFNWNISAELGPGCPRKEVNVVNRCIEICGDGIDNDSDGEIDEACNPFVCDGNLLQSIDRDLFSMSISPVNFTLLNTFPFGINSLAYSAADNLIYAMVFENPAVPNQGDIVRIAANGEFQVLDGLITRDGIVLDGGFAADIGSDGNYYFLDNATETLYIFELVTLTEISRVQLNYPNNIADITYNPQTGNIFGITGGRNKRLYEFDPVTGNTITYPVINFLDENGNQLNNQANGGVIGGIYFLPGGNMIAYGSFLQTNDQNDMIQINLNEYRNTGNVLVVDQNNRIARSNDGASCPYTIDVTKTANVVDVSPAGEIEYTIQINNNTGFEAPNVTFRDSLSDFLTIQSISVNDLGNNNIEPGTGVNTKDLLIRDVNIPVGISTIRFTAKVDSVAICEEDTIFNQAEMTNLSAALGFRVLSDEPGTPAQRDPTLVDLNINYIPDIPQIISNAPLCEGDTLFLEEQSNARALFWEGPNGYASRKALDTLLNATALIAGEYLAFTDSVNCPSDTVRIIVEVNDIPEASIAPVEPICLTDSRQLDASSDIASSTFAWIINTDGLSSTTINNPVSTPTETEEYTVEVTSPAGCKDTTTAILVINPNPEVQVSDDTSICITFSAPLEASGADSYTWSPALGLNATTGVNVLASPSSTTMYQVVGENSFGCLDSATVTVNLKTSPVITDPSDEAICLNDSVSITTSGADSYIWGPELGLSNTSGSSSFAKPITNTTYEIIGTNTEGCTDTVSFIITVNPLPTVSVTDSVTICRSESTVLTASGADSYSWSPSSGLANTNQASVNASPQVNMRYQVIGLTTFGCADTNLVPVTVLDNPIPEIEIDYLRDICEGEQLDFFITSSAFLGDNPTFEWEVNNTTNGNTQDNLTLVNQSTAPTVILKVVSSERCVAPANRTLSSDPVTPQVFPFPDLRIPDIGDVCGESAVTLTAVDDRNVATSYRWIDLNTNAMYSSNTNTLELGIINSAQSVRVLASENGCADSTDFTVNVVIVNVDIRADRTTILEGEEVEISAFTNGEITSSFSDLDPSFSITENGQTVNSRPTDSTNFIVDARLQECISSDTVIVNVLKRLNAPYFFSPNGDDENDLWIIKELDTYENTRVSIYNRWGTRVIQLDDGVNTWSGNYGSGSDAPEGVYYYVIEGEAAGNDISLTGYVTIAR